MSAVPAVIDEQVITDSQKAFPLVAANIHEQVASEAKLIATSAKNTIVEAALAIKKFHDQAVPRALVLKMFSLYGFNIDNTYDQYLHVGRFLSREEVTPEIIAQTPSTVSGLYELSQWIPTKLADAVEEGVLKPFATEAVLKKYRESGYNASSAIKTTTLGNFTIVSPAEDEEETEETIEDVKEGKKSSSKTIVGAKHEVPSPKVDPLNPVVLVDYIWGELCKSDKIVKLILEFESGMVQDLIENYAREHLPRDSDYEAPSARQVLGFYLARETTDLPKKQKVTKELEEDEDETPTALKTKTQTKRKPLTSSTPKKPRKAKA